MIGSSLFTILFSFSRASLSFVCLTFIGLDLCLSTSHSVGPGIGTLSTEKMETRTDLNVEEHRIQSPKQRPWRHEIALSLNEWLNWV